MAVADGIRHARRLTMILASVAAVSLTVVNTGGQPASAQPVTDVYPTETAYAPTAEAPADTPPADEAPAFDVPTQVPTQVLTPVAPEPPPEPTIQAPSITPQTQEPVETPTPTATQEPVATEAPSATQQPAVTQSTQAPEAATTAPLPQTTSEPASETAPAPTQASPTPKPTGTEPMPTPTAEPTTQVRATTTVATTETTAPSGSSTPQEESTQTTSDVAPAGGSTASSGVTQSAELAADVTQTPEPQRLAASPQDIKTAQAAPPIKEDPPPAPLAEINRLRDLVLPAADQGANGPANVAADAAPAAGELRVLQWQPDWVQYDQYFRPLIFNPYPEPLRVVYDVAGLPRILIIPPFGRIVTEVRDLGSYNFTALRLNPLGAPIDVAVGNFFGGGYFPGPGLPPPPPPPPVRTLTDVPVQVKYTSATYRPIVVRKLVDVGPDPAVGGAHKVLLDGVTPAWGEWKQNANGVPQFEVHQTQSFPGMEAPAEGPLPGDYDLQLMNESKPTGLDAKDLTLIIAAAIVAAVGVGAIFFTVFLGRRRRIRH